MKCLSVKELQGDHIKPKSLYPHESLNIHNIQILCRYCNELKSNYSEIDYRSTDDVLCLHDSLAVDEYSWAKAIDARFKKLFKLDTAKNKRLRRKAKKLELIDKRKLKKIELLRRKKVRASKVSRNIPRKPIKLTGIPLIERPIKPKTILRKKV